ncbi:E3 ubiquitin-protein ligase TRIM39-like isoform X2 [Acipenser ruthenus]|uniref:E3 ubiquitin-protein ligase TRIM39-like isoform X2 n=1 Tax=Acipenser ruthenus TaxID=7906 RepID=UPI00274041CA|nr:E3 ubiquitin-protein ligase TRIM39-like isoform X2 [Acipenser ruthenus]
MAPLHQSEASFEAVLFVSVAAFMTLVVMILLCVRRRGYEELQREQSSEEPQEQLNHLKREIKRLRKEKEDLQKNYDSLKREKERLVKEKEDLQKNYDSLKREKERLVKEKEDLQKNYDTLKKEKENAKADFEEFRRKTSKTMCDRLAETSDVRQKQEGKILTPGSTADFEEFRRKTSKTMCDRLAETSDVRQKQEGKILTPGSTAEWKTITDAHVNVTLDPSTANLSLTVSEDGSEVKFTGKRSAEWPSVLGGEGFTSGRHYWEVVVGEKENWVLGVSTHRDEKSIPEKPEEGYWLVRRAKKFSKSYTAVSQSGDQILKLEVCKVWGVYLDWKEGRLSFYNAETKVHIHTFEGSFPGQVYPIFSPGSKGSRSLIIH